MRLEVLRWMLVVATAGCLKLGSENDNNSQVGQPTGDPPIQGSANLFLVLDEDSIDNGLPPNFFSDLDVNDQIAEVGVRETLRYFRENVGEVIDLHTGQVEDEGWFAPMTIPSSWRSAGPTDDGIKNFLVAGPGLGSAGGSYDREDLLDKIPDVKPLREAELYSLAGRTVCAVVYDSDVSINYSPLNGSLKGANLGTVSFEVLEV